MYLINQLNFSQIRHTETIYTIGNLVVEAGALMANISTGSNGPGLKVKLPVELPCGNSIESKDTFIPYPEVRVFTYNPKLGGKIKQIRLIKEDSSPRRHLYRVSLSGDGTMVFCHHVTSTNGMTDAQAHLVRTAKQAKVTGDHSDVERLADVTEMNDYVVYMTNRVMPLYTLASEDIVTALSKVSILGESDNVR